MLPREGEPDHLLPAVFFGLVIGPVFGLTAALERLWQRRLELLGIWDGS
jgi:hypothetical protein